MSATVAFHLKIVDTAGMKTFKTLSAQLADRLLKIQFVATAVSEQADLSAFNKKPSLRIILGLLCIGLSYLIGWPAVAGLGIVAIKLNQPLIAIIGGALIYGLSHLVFILGMYLAGAEYSVIFLRWLSRTGVEKLQAWSQP